MTTTIGLICREGFVIGADMKAVAGDDTKYQESKIVAGTLGTRPLVVGGAGSHRHILRAADLLGVDPDNPGSDFSFDDFLCLLEENLPKWTDDYRIKYGDQGDQQPRPDFELIVGAIDKDKKPRLIQVQNDGEYCYCEEFAVIGTGREFAEPLLRKLYDPKMSRIKV